MRALYPLCALGWAVRNSEHFEYTADDQHDYQYLITGIGEFMRTDR